MPAICVFDVNETLLDLNALNPHFEAIFGDAAVRAAWFGQMLQSAMVSIITNTYAPFGTIGMAALEMVAARRGVTLTDEHRQRIREGMTHLPPHPEVRQNLERLRAAGMRMATLTNSTQQVVEAQLTNSGLRDLFEAALSSDAIKRLKPAPEPYHMAAEKLGVAVHEIRLIAAHAWDIAGALRAGCKAAFVARPGVVLDPLVDTPDIVGPDMRTVVDQILAHGL